LALILVVAITFGLAIAFYASQPQWILTAANLPHGLRIGMITTESDTPVYEVLVLGRNLSAAPLRFHSKEAARQHATGITTLFIDRSLGPGRWVFQVGTVHIDC
jgi:hypothetical protein